MLFDLFLLFLLVSPNPIKLLNFLMDFVEPPFEGLVFGDLSVGGGLSDDIVNLGPAIGLFFVDDDPGLACPVGSGGPACSMYVGIAIDWYSHLYDMSNVEIQSSGSHVSRNQDVAESRFFKFLQFLNSLLLLHVGMQTHRLHAKSLEEELNSSATFDGVGEQNHLTVFREVLQVADGVDYALDLPLGEAKHFFQSFGQEEERTLVDDFWLF